ncbi:MAG: hypothetical protein KAI25_00020 [Hyphomicrobiaceae bacterium]|nr:hypothetical protein [Hyphomicrobiaceae bacterium]
MSRGTYTPIQPGDTREAAKVNDIFDAFEAALPLTAENFREEGLDARVFEDSVHYRRSEAPIATHSVSVLTEAAYATLVLGATTFRTGGITLEAGELLEINFRCQLPSSATSGIPLGTRPSFRIAYFPSGGALTVIADSVREKEVAAGPFFPPGGLFDCDGSVSILTDLEGPLDLDFVEVQFEEPLGPGTGVRCGYGLFTNKIWRVVTPT